MIRVVVNVITVIVRVKIDSMIMFRVKIRFWIRDGIRAMITANINVWVTARDNVMATANVIFRVRVRANRK